MVAKVHVLLFFRENPRILVLTGEVVVGDRSLEGDCSFEVLLLLADCDRCLVSSRTSSRLTLSCEYGVSEVSNISTNLEVDMSCDNSNCPMSMRI